MVTIREIEEREKELNVIAARQREISAERVPRRRFGGQVTPEQQENILLRRQQAQENLAAINRERERLQGLRNQIIALQKQQEALAEERGRRAFERKLALRTAPSLTGEPAEGEAAAEAALFLRQFGSTETQRILDREEELREKGKQILQQSLPEIPEGFVAQSTEQGTVIENLQTGERFLLLPQSTEEGVRFDLLRLTSGRSITAEELLASLSGDVQTQKIESETQQSNIETTGTTFALQQAIGKGREFLDLGIIKYFETKQKAKKFAAENIPKAGAFILGLSSKAFSERENKISKEEEELLKKQEEDIPEFNKRVEEFNERYEGAVLPPVDFGLAELELKELQAEEKKIGAREERLGEIEAARASREPSAVTKFFDKTKSAPIIGDLFTLPEKVSGGLDIVAESFGKDVGKAVEVFEKKQPAVFKGVTTRFEVTPTFKIEQKSITGFEITPKTAEMATEFAVKGGALITPYVGATVVTGETLKGIEKAADRRLTLDARAGGLIQASVGGAALGVFAGSKAFRLAREPVFITKGKPIVRVTEETAKINIISGEKLIKEGASFVVRAEKAPRFAVQTTRGELFFRRYIVRTLPKGADLTKLPTKVLKTALPKAKLIKIEPKVSILAQTEPLLIRGGKIISSLEDERRFGVLTISKTVGGRTSPKVLARIEGMIAKDTKALENVINKKALAELGFQARKGAKFDIGEITLTKFAKVLKSGEVKYLDLGRRTVRGELGITSRTIREFETGKEFGVISGEQLAEKIFLRDITFPRALGFRKDIKLFKELTNKPLRVEDLAGAPKKLFTPKIKTFEALEPELKEILRKRGFAGVIFPDEKLNVYVDVTNLSRRAAKQISRHEIAHNVDIIQTGITKNLEASLRKTGEIRGAKIGAEIFLEGRGSIIQKRKDIFKEFFAEKLEDPKIFQQVIKRIREPIIEIGRPKKISKIFGKTTIITQRVPDVGIKSGVDAFRLVKDKGAGTVTKQLNKQVLKDVKVAKLASNVVAKDVSNLGRARVLTSQQIIQKAGIKTPPVLRTPVKTGEFTKTTTLTREKLEPKISPVAIERTISKVTPREITRVVPREISREITRAVPKEVTKEISREITRTLPKLTTKLTPKLTAKQITKLTTKSPSLTSPTKITSPRITTTIPSRIRIPIPTLRTTAGIPRRGRRGRRRREQLFASPDITGIAAGLEVKIPKLDTQKFFKGFQTRLIRGIPK